jgi:transcriptional regulator with XRE-family HTH domain
MRKMLRTLLENEMERKNLTLREAAKEMGISHSTLIAAREGTRKLDIKTALAISNWLGMPLADLVGGPEGISSDRTVTYQALAIVLEAVPDLEQVFIDAAKELEEGTLSLTDFKDIVEYAAYKIRTRREQAQANEQGKSLQKGGR